jgi:hypothetical protein
MKRYGSLEHVLGVYKVPGASFNLVRRHVLLNGDVLCLNRALLVQFLREKIPFKKKDLFFVSHIWDNSLKAVNFLVRFTNDE